MNLTNRKKLPEPLVRAVTNDPYNPGESDYTVTGLIAPVRIAHLSKLYRDKITEDVADRIWALLGSAIHVILERAAGDDSGAEKRVYGDVLGKRISGQWDYWSEGTLQDYKVTSAWSFISGVKPEWEQQLNMLAWLADQNMYHVDKLQIVAIYRDWSKTQMMRSDSYPRDQVEVIDIPLWGKEKQLAFIEERVRAHEGETPLCTNEERWYRGEKWAVMKKGRKSAVRLYDDEQSAINHAIDAGSNHSVDHRLGNYARCEGYCPVSAFCTQWNGEEEVNILKRQAE